MVKATKFLYLLLFLLTPLIFTTFNSELFEIPKMYFVYAVTLIIFILHIINYFRGKVSLVSKSPLNLPLLLFLLSQIISTIQSVDVHTSFFGYYSRLNGGLLSLLAFSLLFFILENYLDDKFKKDVVNFSLISGSFVAAYGILQHFGVDKNSWPGQFSDIRVFSTLGQANWLAAYLCILLPLCFHRLHNSQGKFRITYYGLLITSLFLSLLFTKSKSGLIAAGICLAIYFILNFKKSPKLLGTLYLVLITLSLIINNPIKDLFFHPSPTTQATTNSTINITPSTDIRRLVWSGAVTLAKKFPLFGTGPETFGYTYYWVRPASHNLTSEWEFLYNKVHNEYLNYLANTGFIGLIAYLLLIYSSIYLLISQKFWFLLASYISILITNFAGFSVVTVSLFFFLLPLLAVNPIPINTPRFLRFPFLILSAFLVIYLSTYLLKYFLADLSLHFGQEANKQDQYLVSYQYFLKGFQLNPQEPTIISELSVTSSQLSSAFFLQKSATDSAKMTTNAIALSDLSLQISPFNVNLWKLRTQMYLYLSTFDSKYYTNVIETLKQTITVAPTDAKSFYLLGKVYEAINDPTQAINYYQQAIDLKSNYDHAYFDLGRLLFDQKKYDLAKTSFESALKYAPTNTAAQDYLKTLSTLQGTLSLPTKR